MCGCAYGGQRQPAVSFLPPFESCALETQVGKQAGRTFSGWAISLAPALVFLDKVSLCCYTVALSLLCHPDSISALWSSGLQLPSSGAMSVCLTKLYSVNYIGMDSI